MKKDLHPENYRYVVFQDLSCDYSFLTRSTVETKETIKWEDGKEYEEKFLMDILQKDLQSAIDQADKKCECLKISDDAKILIIEMILK